MGLNQIHEQNNAVMKDMGGATPSLNKVDESSFARWGPCIHELTSIVNEYDFEENDMNSTYEAQRHHENSVAFQKRFTTDVNCLEKAVISNPFILEKLTVLNNNDKAKFNDRVFEDIKIIETETEKQFLHFWEKRQVSSELSINVPIPLNLNNLPGNYNKKPAYDPVMTAVMMTKFVDAGKNRRYLVEDALNTDVFGIVQSLASVQFSVCHGTKSSIIASLIQTTDVRKIQPDASGCVIELSMLLRRKQPSWVQIFADFSKFLYNKIMDISSLFNRCDVITDQYFEGSLKEGTRENCGSGTGLIVTYDDCSEIPSNFISKFLNNVTNKMNLNKYLVNKFLNYHEGKQSILCVTFGDSIFSNSQALFSETDINQCSSEEVDRRIVRRVINLGKKGYTNVQVKTVDSDVVILCLTHADVAMSNGIESFLVLYGSKDKKIDIIDNFNKLGVSVCKSLTFFHAFTGCDTVSSFYRVRKAKF